MDVTVTQTPAELAVPAASTVTPPVYVAPSVTENIREREVFRYDDLGFTSAAINDPHAPIPPESLVSATDQSLTSYAQLGVYRLNSTRALISLFDRERQHIVAEATARSPVRANKKPNRKGEIHRASATDTPDNDRPSAGVAGGQIVSPEPRAGDSGPTDDSCDRLWLCGTAIPRSFGICEHVLVSSGGNGTNAQPEDPAARGESDELPVSIVPDLNDDVRFQDRPYINGRPFNRFYAGVPIRTPGPHGMNIGVFCIFDTAPRPQGLDSDQIEFMQDISRTVMSYLECRASHGRFRRSERMVRGMGSFVEGLDSLAPAGKPSSGNHYKRRSLRPGDQPDSTLGGGGRRSGTLATRSKKPDTLFKTINAGNRIPDDVLLSPRTPNPPSASRDLTLVGLSSPLLDPGTTTDLKGSRQSSLNAEDSSRCSTPRPESQQSGEYSPKPAVVSQISTADLQLVETGRVFSKAANIIRQSLETDGVVFLDATVRSFGGLVGQRSERKVSAVGMDNLNYLSNDEDSNREATPPTPAAKDDYCGLLGYAVPSGASGGTDSLPWQSQGLRDRTLQKLLRRYPHGRIWNFEANGEVLQPPVSFDREPLTPNAPPKRPATPARHWSHDSQDPDDLQAGTNTAAGPVPTVRRQRWNAAESVIKLFPGARSVVIIPLWDGQKKRWAAGGFIWTKSPTRVFTSDGTLRFLRVFGLIIMAEIYRLNTKAEETIKSNILGSISHELRSPLHGLVGAVELLHDSKLDAVQQNVLNIIETSGKTLVDTINHLLDYSKINSFIENDKKDSLLGKVGAEPKDRSVQEKVKSQTLPVELDCLVEEVVESVLAGFSHERMSGPRAMRHVTEYQRQGEVSMPSDLVGTDRVQIYLDIEPSNSWRFRTHPGAFRRIVMNLFGNSLKFTKSGFIKISLSLETARPYDPDAPATVLLSVADSGKGISEDYLQNSLFTPFCQEDHFAPGTGLGLSLVRQITVNLGGEIKVASQVGRGTTITVSLPLPPAGEEVPLPDVTGAQHVEMLRGRKIVLRGFDNLPMPESRPMVHGLEDAGKILESQAHVLQNTCKNWLQMQVVSELDALRERPDFIVHHDSTLSFEDAERIAAQAPCPVLFVCEASVAVRNFSCNLPDANSRIRTFEFFSPPLGPRKLAKGLVHLLDMWKVKQDQGETVQHTTSVEVLPIAAGGNHDLSLDKTASVFSAQRIEIGHGMKLVKSTRSTRIAPGASGGQTAGFQASPLPTPPEDPRSKDLMAKSEPEAVVAAVPVEDSENDDESRPAVLIADDNAINLKILSAYMKKLKRPHATAVNGLESLTLYEKSPSSYCCILTDISMPTMDGLESARRIRQFERENRLQQTPVIALTGLAGASVQEDAVASGVDMFLTRPVTLQRLVEALQAVGVE